MLIARTIRVLHWLSEVRSTRVTRKNVSGHSVDRPSRSYMLLAAVQCLFLVACGGGGSGNSSGSVTSQLPYQPLVVQSAVLTTPTQICDDQYVVADGVTDASAAMQSCLDKGMVTIELPAGTILLNRQLIVRQSVTVTTAGSTPDSPACVDSTLSCANLVISPLFNEPNGVIHIANTDNVVLDRVVVNGNRINRLQSPPAAQCSAGNNRSGFNVTVHGCKQCGITRSMFVNALCGTSLEWIGENGTISNNTFARNGDSSQNNMWSDGLTALQADNTQIYSNTFYDNTDIGLIIGGGRFAVIRDNMISQKNAYAFAGLMMDNFWDTTTGNFEGAVVSGNRVECSHCFFGMNIGPMAWRKEKSEIFAGEIVDNVVLGGVIGINVDGIAPSSPVRVARNELGPPAAAAMRCRSGLAVTAARFSVSSLTAITPDSSQPDVVQSTAGCI